jgi:hypothetical protein
MEGFKLGSIEIEARSPNGLTGGSCYRKSSRKTQVFLVWIGTRWENAGRRTEEQERSMEPRIIWGK